MIGNFIGAPIGGAVNTSGTLYSQAISASGTGLLITTRSAGKRVSLSGTVTLGLVRAIARVLGFSASSSVSAGKAATHHGPTISGTGAPAVTFTKTILRSIAVLTSGVCSVSFHAGRVVMIHMTAMGNAILGPKQISKSVVWAATGTITIIKAVTKTVSVTLTAAITYAFAFFRFITQPFNLGKQITTQRTNHTQITTDGSTSSSITGSPAKNTDITSSNTLQKNITT
jgi:hypothetical protein